MVQTFQTITRALEQKKTSSNSAALSYAAKQVSKNVNSTSGQLYADHLSQAAEQLKDQKMDTRNALGLLQMLIGSGQTSGNASSGDLLGTLLGGTQQPSTGTQGASSASGDLLGSLLGSMVGSESQAASPQASGDMLGSLLGSMMGGDANTAQNSSQPGGDMLGSLLGSMMGGSNPSQPQSQTGGDLLGALLGTAAGGSQSSTASGQGQSNFQLLNAALAFLQAKQGGQGNLQALLQAYMAGSGMGNSAHRTQSTEVVVNSFLQALQGMSS